MNIIIPLLLLILLLFVGCKSDDIVYINKEVCRQPGNYCHTFIIDGGTANIGFPSVIGGDFNYSVEGV